MDNLKVSDLDAQILDRIRAVGLPNLPGNVGTMPLATNFKVARRDLYPDRVEVVLVWNEPISIVNPIDHFRISVTGAVGNNQVPMNPSDVSRSPAKLSIPLTPGITGLTFKIQTALKNGYFSTIDNAPTCGLQVQPSNLLNSTPSGVLLSTITLTGTGAIDTYSIPANTAVQGSIYRFTMSGDYIMVAASANPVVNINTTVSGGSSTNAALGYNGVTGAVTRSPFRYWYELCFRSIGTSGSIAITSAIAAPDTVGSGSSASASTVDTTASISLVCSCTTFTNFTDVKIFNGYHEIFKNARF
jgi:hypothetical protein